MIALLSRRLGLWMFLVLVVCGADAAEPAGNLHVAGGIALPAKSTAVFTNPAGMVGVPTAIVTQIGAPEVWGSGTYRLGLQTGGPSIGAAGGLEYRDRRSDALYGYYGLGVGVSSFSFGIAGRSGLSNANGTTFQLGALYAYGAATKFGLTVRGLGDGVGEFGFGAAYEVTGGVHLVLDAATDDDFGNPELKPGLKVGNDMAALTVSYGTDARQQFADGFTLGGSYRMPMGSVFEIQYNAGGNLAKYFASVAWSF